ncbi:MAG: hypothetical protein JXO49_12060 [Deltaproteobacteria bacterium]|nr:hypothetical protein [Candidatus Anaeroferrophillus wilburensis]MBN2890068.1 hypothetical protein [Deltaproteobacteria bacterium]
MFGSKLKKEYRQIRKMVTEVNAKLTKLAEPQQIREAGASLGLVDRDGTLNLVKQSDTEAMMDLLIFQQAADVRPLPAVFLDSVGDDFLPALERQLLENYLKGTVFSLFAVTDWKKKDFLTLEPLLDGTSFELFDAVLGRIADESWMLAGRFVPFGDRWIHTGVIYAFDLAARERLLSLLDEVDEATGASRRASVSRFPCYFYQWYRDFGTPLGQR